MCRRCRDLQKSAVICIISVSFWNTWNIWKYLHIGHIVEYLKYLQYLLLLDPLQIEEVGPVARVGTADKGCQFLTEVASAEHGWAR